jgi:NAD-dependent SIR2 family protein deacetylase
MLKPDVVFFGESVPRSVVATGLQNLAAADAMLVVGSSLMVYSGFRFVKLAAERGLPIAIVNRGKTRADELATLKLACDCEGILPRVVSLLRA